MKQSWSKIQRRMVQAGGMVAIVAAIVVSIAASKDPEQRYKLGGPWVGEIGGIQWSSIHTPLGSDGKTAVAKLEWATLTWEMLALRNSVGADRITEAVGTFEMISKDTAKYTVMWYAVKTGDPSATPPVGDKVMAINVVTGLWHFTGPNTAESKEWYSVYLADKNPLLPVEGSTVVVDHMAFDWHPQYRVPMLD